MYNCRRCGLALPADAYPRGDVLLDDFYRWCVQCICDYQAQEHGLESSVLRDRAALRRTIALAVDDRVATA